MNTEKTKRGGRLLAEAFLSANTIDGLPPDLHPTDVAEATAMQHEMAKAIGEPVVGWKVGGRPGPLVGRIFGSRLFQSPATLSRKVFDQAGLECEIGFRMTESLPPRARPYGVEEVAAAAYLAFTIELTHSRFTRGKHSADTDFEMLSIVADNASAAALIVGPTVPHWRDLSLLDIAVEARVNGGAPIPPNPREKRTEPLDVLVWLANELSNRGIGLSEGQYVTTGSATLPLRLSAGDAVVANYGSFGQITAEVLAYDRL